MADFNQEQINRFMANEVGLNPQQVAFLRGEFGKFGRNPLPADLEILAIEHQMDENKVKVISGSHNDNATNTVGVKT